jgi:hypothetical protein
MTRGPGADKGRTRATSLSRPRPRKPGQDLGRVCVDPDAAGIRFRDGSARWAGFLSGWTHPSRGPQVSLLAVDWSYPTGVL